MHIPDLTFSPVLALALSITVVSYHQADRPTLPLAVGWLDGTHPYPTYADESERAAVALLLPGLESLCLAARIRSLRVHFCELCPPGLGYCTSGEVFAFGPDGTVFVAPRMIRHYIVDHAYLPPAEFREAVLGGPSPETPEYGRRLALLLEDRADLPA